jgi:hypothetical protein
MKYQIVGWVALASVAFWAAPFAYAAYQLVQW